MSEFTSFVKQQQNQNQNPKQEEPSLLNYAASIISINSESDVDLLVHDAVAAMTDSRPPANLVLYKSGATTVANNTNNTEQQQQAGPPIFDGSVANATPSLVAGHGGGVGTALHVATALDRPLTLALLLAMGGDARAVHTAFRRFMIHEAACNGSIKCLNLLLELGTTFGREIQQEMEIRENKTDTSIGDDAELSSPNSSMDFPCLKMPSAMLRPSSLNMLYSPSAAAPKSSSTNAYAFEEEEEEEEMQQVSDGSSVLSLLISFRNLAQQVTNKELTELDAARLLIQQATLSEPIKAALARQCGCLPLPLLSFRSAAAQRNSANSDGHGNTPLHWSAFKNETACVSLLLKYNADPNARAHPSGWTPLHDAAYSNGKESIGLLVDAGAQVDARANSGATPLCFAAQEDAAEAAELLLRRGADLSSRCCSPNTTTSTPPSTTTATPPHSRFSGYTPLHYCAHYNAHQAGSILLQHHAAAVAMEIEDLQQRLPIHVAVARGSSDVLRELLRAGARVETRKTAVVSPFEPPVVEEEAPASTAATQQHQQRPPSPLEQQQPPLTPRRGRSNSASPTASPVSSPVLRSMIPSQPVQSSKPWNCLSQRSIDECRQLISEVESSWTPDRHSLFTPTDRRAVAELLRVGKRLELDGSLQFVHLWPEVLSFCGRGWFAMEAEEEASETEIEYLDVNEEDKLALPTFC